MTITSKFDYKQKVFWLENNKVRSAVVTSIHFGRFFRMDGKDYLPEPMYFVAKSVKSKEINWNGGGLREKQLFASKKELLNSL